MNGCERLKSMVEKEKFSKSIIKIYMYLKTRKDMYEKYLNPEKNLQQMYKYIRKQIEKQSVDGVAMVEDPVVYGLAIKYFNESNEKLGISEKEKRQETKECRKDEKQNKTISKSEEREQVSLF